MTTDAGTKLAVDYLAQVDRVARAAGLPRSRRLELQEQLGDHLDETAVDGRASATLEAIDRLGDPNVIVREALRDLNDGALPGAFSSSRKARGGYEVAGLVLVSIGWVFAGLGVFAGIVLTLTSKVWTAGEKLAATISALLPILGFALLLVSATASSTATGPGGQEITTSEPTTIWNTIGAAAAILCVLAPLIVSVALWRRAARREQTL